MARAPRERSPATTPAGSSARPDPPRVWYGWQTLLADGLSLSLTITGLAIEVATLARIGFAGCMLLTPAVHMAHGRVGTGFGSLGVRAAVVLGLSLAWVLANLSTLSAGDEGGNRDDLDRAETGLAVLLTIGGLVTFLFDATVLAYEPAPAPASRASLTPFVEPRSRSAGFALQGAF